VDGKGLGEKTMPNLRERYTKDVVPALLKEFGFNNVMQVPKIEKVVINIGMGSETADNSKVIDAALNDIGIITGQKPVVTKARKSIANFKLREGKAIGVKVTLRQGRMWAFIDRLINVAMPRIRDFRGIPPTGFDGRGNFTLGLKDQLVFPEIEYDKIDKLRGMEITFVTTATTDEQSLRLLKLMGMPFRDKVS
jgi:large subunit ribosomal protein L5